MGSNTQPLVSIACITYNHKKYIAETIESFLAQKTDFAVEILIHDDASTDGTIEILRDYAKKYPNIILLQEKINQYSQGKDTFINTMYKRARGKYMAICEGDDFWTDTSKLQRQVDFLESHSDYAICFHPVRIFFEDKSKPDEIYPAEQSKVHFTLTELLGRNFIQSNSVMYRIQQKTLLPSGIIPLDWYTHLYHAQFGKIGYINRVMATYRRHQGGMWWNATQGEFDAIWKKYGIQHLRLFVELKKLYGDNPKYSAIVDDHISQMYASIVRTDKLYGQDQLSVTTKLFPEATRTYITHTVLHSEQAVADLKRHADEQAKIIEHYVAKTAALEHQVKHPIKYAVKAKLKK